MNELYLLNCPDSHSKFYQ